MDRPPPIGRAAAAAGRLEDREPCELRVLQLNCQRFRGVMAELGRVLTEGRYDVVLLQEPYLRVVGVVAGLPAWMRVFQSGDGGAAVVLANASVDATVVTVPGGEGGATVWARGVFGTLYLSSVYCRHGVPFDSYLQYLEWVSPSCKGHQCWRAWMQTPRPTCGTPRTALRQEAARTARGHENEVSGGEFKTFIVACGLEVLNEPSRHWRFAGTTGRSDIDVSLSKGLETVHQTWWKILPERCTQTIIQFV